MAENDEQLEDVDLDFEQLDNKTNDSEPDPAASVSHRESIATDPSVPDLTIDQRPLISQISQISLDSLRSTMEVLRDDPFTPKSKVSKLLRIQLIIAIVAIAILAAIFHENTVYYLKSFIAWIGDNPFLGSVSFVIAMTVTIPCFIPASVATIGCGYVFYYHFGIGGLVLAIGIVWIGCSGGALICFLLSRYLFRSMVLRFAAQNVKFNAIESMMASHGWQVACIIRLNPVLPFVLENYIFGVSSIRLLHFVISLIAILPGAVLYCFVGSTIHELSSDFNDAFKNSPVSIIFLVTGIVVSVSATIVMTIFARKRLALIREEMENMREQTEELVEHDNDNNGQENVEMYETVDMNMDIR